ncbi:MAG: BamA/TamA family outer membrane protein [Balneolaceae bacterium]|nr:BamA/TamA family outer membrane protein [Balneolaceae bacterium]
MGTMPYSGDRFALANAEFRFPLFAAILPGPIPILPLYNLTGAAFVDAGTAWGQSIPFEVNFIDGSSEVYATNEDELDFRVRDNNKIFLDQSNGDFLSEKPADFDINRDQYGVLPAPQGDVLIGAGFGLRTILLGLPLRYDVAWPYYRDGFGGDAVHYISIGIDF